MNIKDLQYLVAVYELHSFSKAAERCFVSQPTLSGQLKKLEQELNAPLIERSTRKIIFTQLGKSVVNEARIILSTANNIRELAKQADDPMQGDFHIGLIPTIGPFLLPKIISEINVVFPKMNLFLYELQTEVLIDRLLKGQIDAAILARLDWQYPIKELPLYKESLKLAINSTNPLAKIKKPLDQSVLDGQSVLMLEDGHCLRDQALGVCFSAGANEDKRFQATSMDTLLHMVATGAGITLIPELACDNKLEGVTFQAFKKPVPEREVIMAVRRQNPRNTTFTALARLISSLIK